jgi:hypothetical protein
LQGELSSEEIAWFPKVGGKEVTRWLNAHLFVHLVGLVHQPEPKLGIDVRLLS